MTKNLLVKMMVALIIAIMAPLAIPGAATPAAMAQTSFNGVLEICDVNVSQGSTLLVRSGPGAQHSVVGRMNRATRVVVISSIGNWARHSEGGWSSRSYLKCSTYTRQQVSQEMLPQGNWLHPTATLHNSGARAPQYDVVTTRDGTSWQPFLPKEGSRQGHDVSIVQPGGSFILIGVACEVQLDRSKNNGREVLASHTNSGDFYLPRGDNWLRILCDESPVTGFSIVPGSHQSTSNSPYGDRASFVAAEDKGQFLLPAYECETGERLERFDYVKEGNGDFWPPWLPGQDERAQTCFEVPLVLIEGNYKFFGIACELYVDAHRNGVLELVAAQGNSIDFTIDTFQNQSAADGESWGLLICPADRNNGASGRWIEPLKAQVTK